MDLGFRYLSTYVGLSSVPFISKVPGDRQAGERTSGGIDSQLAKYLRQSGISHITAICDMYHQSSRYKVEDTLIVPASDLMSSLLDPIHSPLPPGP